MIIELEDRLPHECSELICLKCLSRWIGVYAESLYLKDIECPKCNSAGYVIKTGQTVLVEGDN